MRRSSKYARKKGITDILHHQSAEMPHDHRTVLKYPYKYAPEVVKRAKLIEELKHKENGIK